MKIYDRKGFLLGLVCFLIVIWEATHLDGAKSIVWIGFFSFMGFGTIRKSLSSEATAKQDEMERMDEKS